MPSSSKDPIPSGDSLGLSCILVINAEVPYIFSYATATLEDILGFKPEELIGTPIRDLHHPDEVAAVTKETTTGQRQADMAGVFYMRLRHKDGHYVNVCHSHSYVDDKIISMTTLAEYGPMTLRKARTARAIVEIIPDGNGDYTSRRWPKSRAASSSHDDPIEGSVSPPPGIPASPGDEVPSVPDPSIRPIRNAFILNRFTETAKVEFMINDAIVNTTSLPGQSFYSIVKPSDRPLAKRTLEATKEWTPIQHKAGKSGGHGYATFHVLKIPDLPPQGELYPQGTDESERHMPGQEFILVEAIFQAASDGVLCVMERKSPKKT